MKLMTTLATSMASMRVCFLTDIEGNWQYVRHFVRQSTCLRFTDAHERQLDLKDDCVLVFGGDAGDKGEDTLHCYSELVRLKKKYPERVVLLVGNRDVNKMRFTSELDDSEMDLRTMARDIYNGPVWVPQAKRITLPKFLTKLMQKKDGEVTEVLPDAELDGVNSKVNRLKWMLDYTMGSDGDFERRRLELTRDQGEASRVVSDDQVLQSFMDSVYPGGVLREYLLMGSLAFIAHNTLFVHGGIINRSTGDQDEDGITLGRVPGSLEVIQDVLEWAEKLNGWYQNELQSWINQPSWHADHKERGGDELMSYVLPSYEHSVVMGRHLDSTGMPVPLPSYAANLLTANSINRIIVGHTPHGTCPTVIKQPQTENRTDSQVCEAVHRFDEVLMCDTSYSDMQAPDNRGLAASEVILLPDGRVQVHGILPDGKRIDYETQESNIGRLLRDGTMVKAKVVTSADEDPCYLVFKVENGYSYTYHYRTLTELMEIGFQGSEQ
ncbi:hypothetical protein Poli38472_004114 [Pythium oligandrum]|uniref:Calcineurin-like phosphoesterase domain-containing protein n=1 Tax=Pythium oligandrum TaxID=41045 RepID=A0A8K1CNI1_PYTOL|nr:hypothetical protein Poli38472_004114 [Pythium oligandrum]|eukprot:TMW66349.1 hypothetical protein Poli38472_004114 [Pythium oligandrum]